MGINTGFYSLSILNNFRCYRKDLSVGPHLRIVRLDALEDDRARVILGNEAISFSQELIGKKYRHNTATLIPFSPSYGDTFNRKGESSNFALEIKYAGEKANYVSEKSGSKAFAQALTALRLIKPQKVGRLRTQAIGDASVHVKDGFAISSPGREDVIQLFELPSASEVYFLSWSHVDNVKKIYRALRNNKITNIQIAIDRMNSLYSATSDEAKLIDAIIALEAVYLFGLRGELQFRLATRVATHIGNKNQKARRRIFSTVKKAYDARSEIIHGMKNSVRETKSFRSGNWKNTDEFIGEINYILRNGIKSILLNINEGTFKQKFHNDLDKRLLE